MIQKLKPKKVWQLIHLVLNKAKIYQKEKKALRIISGEHHSLLLKFWLSNSNPHKVLTVLVDFSFKSKNKKRITCLPFIKFGFDQSKSASERIKALRFILVEHHSLLFEIQWSNSNYQRVELSVSSSDAYHKWLVSLHSDPVAAAGVESAARCHGCNLRLIFARSSPSPSPPTLPLPHHPSPRCGSSLMSNVAVSSLLQ